MHWFKCCSFFVFIAPVIIMPQFMNRHYNVDMKVNVIK